MSIRFHTLTSLFFILAAACADNDLGVGVVDAAPDQAANPGGTGGAPVGGTGGTSATGTGGLFISGTGGVLASTGGTDGGATSPCGAATCLTALFQTCVPEGGCIVHGGGSPSAAFGETCYANGVMVSQVGEYSGTGTGTTSTFSVQRNGARCYAIKGSSLTNASAITYSITDGNGREIATAVTADKEGHISVACEGGTPTTVSSSCLEPVASNSSCTPGVCSSSGMDGGVVDASGGCDPFVAPGKPITLGTVLGVGKSANGTLYVADEVVDSSYRVFVSDGSGTLVRQHASASGVTTDAAGVQYVFSAGDTAPFVLQIEVPKGGATRMGVMPGALVDRKSIVIGQDGEELTVLPSSAVAGLPLRNLTGVTAEYVATLPDGQLLLVTRPTEDWTFTDFRLFLGPTTAVAERAVASVTRYRDGGSTEILFDLDGVQARAYFKVVMGDGGFVAGPATLTVGDAVTPLVRQTTLPAATYRCL